MIELIVAALLSIAPPAHPPKPYLTTEQANALRQSYEAPARSRPVKVSAAD